MLAVVSRPPPITDQHRQHRLQPREPRLDLGIEVMHRILNVVLPSVLLVLATFKPSDPLRETLLSRVHPYLDDAKSYRNRSQNRGH